MHRGKAFFRPLRTEKEWKLQRHNRSTSYLLKPSLVIIKNLSLGPAHVVPCLAATVSLLCKNLISCFGTSLFLIGSRNYCAGEAAQRQSNVIQQPHASRRKRLGLKTHTTSEYQQFPSPLGEVKVALDYAILECDVEDGAIQFLEKARKFGKVGCPRRIQRL